MDERKRSVIATFGSTADTDGRVMATMDSIAQTICVRLTTATRP